MKKAISIFLLSSLFMTGMIVSYNIESSFAKKTHMESKEKRSSQKTHPYITMMDGMMIKMHKAEKEELRCTYTNFLASMIPHHEGAITMSEYEIQHGKNPEMINLAKQIIAEQKKEIKEMQDLLKAYKTCPQEEKITAEYQKAMSKTMKPMMADFPTQKINNEKNPDRAFALAMIPHHQAAIDMSLVILKYSSNPDVKRLAENIIRSQKEEIKQMENFLKKTK